MLKIVIPAAGDGQRFKDAGYDKPKPLIDVAGKPMIQRVIENLTPDQKSRSIVIHRLKELGLPEVWDVVLAGNTQGAVDTLLKAESFVDPEEQLLIANCDQLVDFDVNDFIADADDKDGSLVVFKSNKDHHSYVNVHAGVITDIAEKEVISNHAVTGIYYFKRAHDFFEAAKWVVQENIRTKGEFYVSTAIGFMIANDKKLGVYEAPTAILGTPEELQLFELAIKVGQSI